MAVNGYNDLQDLIQNQRALAKLVNDLNTDHVNLEDTVEYVRSIEAEINNLQTTIDSRFNDFSTRMSNKESDITAMLNQARTTLANLSLQYAELDRIIEDAVNNQHYSIEHLVSMMTSIDSYVMGYEMPGTGIHVDGLLDIIMGPLLSDGVTRRGGLRDIVPTIVIMPEGTNIPENERFEECLYGTITDAVREIESGKAVRLGPNLQGVVQGDDEEIREVQ